METVYLLIYVDDMLLVSKNTEEVSALKEQLHAEFEMKDLGPTSKILGMDIKRDRKACKLTLS